MAHRAERIRKRKKRELIIEMVRAEAYSWQLNMFWNRKIADAFGEGFAIGYPDFSFEHSYDELVRKTEDTRLPQKGIPMGLVTDDEPKVNVFNKHMVGVKGNNIVIMIPPREMSKEDALILAAWLVALAEEEEGEFDKIRLQVSNL